MQTNAPIITKVNLLLRQMTLTEANCDPPDRDYHAYHIRIGSPASYTSNCHPLYVRYVLEWKLTFNNRSIYCETTRGGPCCGSKRFLE